MTCCNLRIGLSFIRFMTGNYTPIAPSGRADLVFSVPPLRDAPFLAVRQGSLT
jgi:hypothetical protein